MQMGRVIRRFLMRFSLCIYLSNNLAPNKFAKASGRRFCLYSQPAAKPAPRVGICAYQLGLIFTNSVLLSRQMKKITSAAFFSAAPRIATPTLFASVISPPLMS